MGREEMMTNKIITNTNFYTWFRPRILMIFYYYPWKFNRQSYYKTYNISMDMTRSVRATLKLLILAWIWPWALLSVVYLRDFLKQDQIDI